jgi:hypothetical protein
MSADPQEGSQPTVLSPLAASEDVGIVDLRGRSEIAE